MSILIAYILFSYIFMFGFVVGVDNGLDFKNVKAWILVLTAPLSAVFVWGVYLGAES